MDKIQVFKVGDDGDVYIFNDLALALDYIRAGFEDGITRPDDGQSYSITVAYITKAEYDAIPEGD